MSPKLQLAYALYWFGTIGCAVCAAWCFAQLFSSNLNHPKK